MFNYLKDRSVHMMWIYFCIIGINQRRFIPIHPIIEIEPSKGPNETTSYNLNRFSFEAARVKWEVRLLIYLCTFPFRS